MPFEIPEKLSNMIPENISQVIAEKLSFKMPENLPFKLPFAEKDDANAQPAQVSYFFKKGYIDVWNTIKGAISRNFKTAEEISKKIETDGESQLMTIIHMAAAICICVFGTAMTLAASAVHVAILALFLCLVYLGFGLAWLVDRIYIYINKISSACPNSACQEKFLIPVYECPACQARHTKLVPSKYGILKRTCICGEKLPTTFLNGRGKLKAYCPICDYAFSGDTASRQFAIPVVGGPSVGKSCLINMALNGLLTEVAPEKNWEMGFLTEGDKADFEHSMQALNSGVRLMKTELDALTAYQLMLKLPEEKVSRRIYIYDISGEMFSSSGDVQKNNAYSYADGFVFLIDPLTIARYAAEVEEEIDVDSYGASSKDFDDILNIMLINLEKMFNLKPQDALKRSLAVVINKCDIPGLEEHIGDAATQQYMEATEECTDLMQAKNAVCKTFLEEYEAGNFVRTAESKFKKVQYFTTSALGHNQEGVPFAGKNVTDPFLWILQNVDASIT